jgi:hypothetical protein
MQKAYDYREFLGDKIKRISLYRDPKKNDLSIIVDGNPRSLFYLATPPMQAKKVHLHGLGYVDQDYGSVAYVLHLQTISQTVASAVVPAGAARDESRRFLEFCQKLETHVLELLWKDPKFAVDTKAKVANLPEAQQFGYWKNFLSNSKYPMVRTDSPQGDWMVVKANPKVDEVYLKGDQLEKCKQATQAAQLIPDFAHAFASGTKKQLLRPVTIYRSVPRHMVIKKPDGKRVKVTEYSTCLLEDKFHMIPQVQAGNLVTATLRLAAFDGEQNGLRFSLSTVCLLDDTVVLTAEPYPASVLADLKTEIEIPDDAPAASEQTQSATTPSPPGSQEDHAQSPPEGQPDSD